jgi:GNAT superfamily N-acetyltransferase
MRGIKRPTQAFILNLYLQTQHQNKGYGKMIMNQLITQLKTQEYESIGLNIHLYESLGFKPTQMNMELSLIEGL